MASDTAWHQIQHGIRCNSGGLGLCSLSQHSCAAFITSFCSSGLLQWTVLSLFLNVNFKVEAGSGHSQSRSQPADILVLGWEHGNLLLWTCMAVTSLLYANI